MTYDEAKLAISRSSMLGSKPLPILPFPTAPDLVRNRGVSEEDRKKGHAQWAEDIDKWRKSLMLDIGNTITAGFASGGAGGGGTTIIRPGTPGKDGKDGTLLNIYKIHVWIAFRTDGIAGEGTIINPYDGSTAAKLDALLRGFDVNTVIHFGPGVFLTQGYAGLATHEGIRWTIKSGWRIEGSGMESTTLKLVDIADAPEDSHLYVCFSDSLEGLVNHIEISDITIDANIDGQSGSVKSGCISIFGANCILYRVRAKGWGSKAVTYQEPFAIAVGGTTPAQGDIEVCYVEKVIIDPPGTIVEAVRGGTMLAVGGASSFVWSAAGITRSGSTATLTVTVPHGLAVGAWFRVRNATQSEYNGSFQVASVVSTTVLTYAVTGTPATPATGSPQLNHVELGGVGILRNCVIKDCYLDGGDTVGVTIAGLTVGGVDGGLVEGNTIRNVERAIYMDTYRGDSLFIRGNYIQRTVTGIYFTLVAEAWGFDTVVVEDNLIELLPLQVVAPDDYSPMENAITNPCAMIFGGGQSTRPYTFRQVAVRNNVMRFTNRGDDASCNAIALGVSSCELVEVYDNYIGFREPRQLRVFDPVARVIAHGNRNVDGQIVLVNNFYSGLYYYDPDVDADRTQKLAFLAL